MKSSSNNVYNRQITIQSYQHLLDEQGFDYKKQHVWLVVGNPSFVDSYLVYLSVCLAHANSILQAILPLLKRTKSPFMLVKDQLQHNHINNHAFPPVLFGKPLLVFFQDMQQLQHVSRMLAFATRQFSGMLLPNGLRIGSICYVAHSNRSSVAAENTFPYTFTVDADLRLAFPNAKDWEQKPVSRFIAHRYLPIRLLTSSHKGNILLGIDLLRLRYCFIKQARPWTGEDLHGRQMRDRLQWQKIATKKLQDRVAVPTIFTFHTQHGYDYLITRFIQADSLDSMIKAGVCSLTQRLVYLQRALKELLEMHQAGYIHRDLSAKNILVQQNGNVLLSDLELAYPIQGCSEPAFESGTIGYMSPQQTAGSRPHPADDSYAIAALVYYIYTDQHPKILHKLSQDLRREAISSLPLDPELQTLLQAAISDDESARPEISRLWRVLSSYEKQASSDQSPRQVNSLRGKMVTCVLLLALAIASVYLLWLSSDDSNLRNNGFTRQLIGAELHPVKTFPIPEDSKYLVGIVADTLYLSDRKVGKVTALCKHTGTYRQWIIPLDSAYRSEFAKSSGLQLDGHYIYLYDGAKRRIVRQRLLDGSVHQYAVSDVFTRLQPISAQTAIIRKFIAGERDQALYRYDFATGKSSKQTRLTAVQTDGGFSSSGLLAYDPQRQRLAYVARYANHIRVLDSNLRVISNGNSIDTFHYYRTRAVAVQRRATDILTNDGPQKSVNQHAVMTNNRLYIHSMIKADNEKLSDFESSTAIDVYNQDNLQYLGSYRLRHRSKASLRNFYVKQDTLYAMFPSFIYRYEIGLCARDTCDRSPR
ncbi:protein kinase [Sphingobacterium oryzagri]|uniref:Protein kinase n=1 Tax=Sphingobacterium oryzagri TaxID=3025669 RepID=A0ABY7WFX2_9SPHI|nr:protein kinase [Sphingobacterium sp. KACC 22765]WDF67180.1 protein kinase [Sphingobacterium sp. KACC 22765]